MNCRKSPLTRAEVAAHVAEAHRDALAAYRAVLTDDRDGLAVILGGTPCVHCLLVTVMLVGLSLAVRGPGDLGPGGEWSPGFTREVMTALAATQAAYRDGLSAAGGLS
jgi:hypothetical protein